MKRGTENGGLRNESEERRMSRFPLFVSIFLLVVGLAVSCTSRKKLVSTKAQHSDFEWMTAKINGEVTTLNSQFSTLNFTGTVRMRRDSVIWLSASAFMGMEGIRVLVTQDSVKLVNRIDQTYFVEPLAEVAARYHWPGTFKETQALLLGDTVELRLGPYLAKMRFSDIRWDEPTTFPMKINKNYQKIKP